MKRRIFCIALIFALILAVMPAASAKTTPNDQTVETVFFYATNSDGQQVLVSQLPVADMAADLDAGRINNELHNYVTLDHYITPVHQEAQGFTVPEFVSYAQSKSTAAAVKSAGLTFQGNDKIAFWEMEQAGYDDEDTYTYQELYGVQRYNFPLLYQYWDYKLQDYRDPSGSMSREQVIEHIFKNGEEEMFLLSVRGFSQRYMITTAKIEAEDYNMEGYWNSLGLLDSARSLRVMVGMTKAELFDKTPTAHNTRYWTQSIQLDMASRPQIKPLGAVAAPTAKMYEGTDGYYYIHLECATQGASIYYNHNFGNVSYMPTARYTEALRIPASFVKSGAFTINARAVKDGYTDAGVTALKLTSSGTQEGWKNPFTDISSSDWYYGAVVYAVEEGLFEGTSGTTFSPASAMSRAMFVTVMSRLSGADVSGYTTAQFSDAAAKDWHFKYVNWAAATGIVQGTGGGQFSPNSDISLEAMILVLYRHSGETVSASAKLPGGVGAISDWAEDAMRWANAQKLFVGVGGTLSSKGGATRAQVAAVLMNYGG